MKDCRNCANKDIEKGFCEFSDHCIASYNAVTHEYGTPTFWKPREGYEPDTVNHPSHYETGRFECFDVMVEALGVEETKGFCLCNAFKYIYRCKIKHETPVEDIKKAIWYLNKYIELEGEQNVKSKE